MWWVVVARAVLTSTEKTPGAPPSRGAKQQSHKGSFFTHAFGNSPHSSGPSSSSTASLLVRPNGGSCGT